MYGVYLAYIPYSTKEGGQNKPPNRKQFLILEAQILA